MRCDENQAKWIGGGCEKPWIFRVCTECRRAMLHAGDVYGLMKAIAGTLQKESPFTYARFALEQGQDFFFFPENDHPGSSIPGFQSHGGNNTVIAGGDELSGLFPDAAAHGFTGAMFLPIGILSSGAVSEGEKEVSGTLSVYVSGGYECSSEEVGMLEELMDDFGETFLKLLHNSWTKEEIIELTSQKEMYKSVFQNTGTGTIIIDRDMLILFANTNFAAMAGYTREELENKMKWSEFVIPGDNKKMQHYHYGRRKGLPGIPDEYECRVFNKSNEIKYMHMKVGMIPGTDRSIASFMDITSRKLAEERLRESESRLSTIVRTFEGLIYITSKDYAIEFMNTALIKRTGINAVGEKCHQVVHGFKTPCPWCSIKNVLTGETCRREERSPKDGRWYSSIHSPVYDSRGRITGTQTILMDITERKHEEEKMAENAITLRKENFVLRSAMKKRVRFENIVGKSAAMQMVYDLIIKAASSSAHVILYGESGTGKELVARAIHNLSSRSGNAFVPVNCGAVSENIIESEFFGYRKGAFTGAIHDKKGYLDASDGGTLFLDEIGDIGLNMQVKLLRTLDGGGYVPVGDTLLKKSNLRIVAATHKNLKDLVSKGLMREDFFYRVHIIPIKLPPLRDRKEDLPLLVDHFLSLYGGDTKVPPLERQVMEEFRRYDWPGNIRELQNTLRRFVTLKKIDFIEGINHGNRQQAPTAAGMNPMEADTGNSGGDLPEMISDFEKRMIVKHLEENRWGKAKTADALGIHRKTLFTKMKKHGLI